MPDNKKDYGPDGTPQPPLPPLPPPMPPTFYNVHSCYMSGFLAGPAGHLSIYDNEVPEGAHGHELYLAFVGLGIGVVSGSGTLGIKFDSWEAFYNNVKAFSYAALPPDPDHPDSSKAHTSIIFIDENSQELGCAIPDFSIDAGFGVGSVEVKS